MKRTKISQYTAVQAIVLTIIIFSTVIISSGFSAVDTLRIATYNILDFPDDSYLERIPYFRTVLLAVDPDILVVQEINTQDGVNVFLASVMNYYQADKYAAAPFVDGPGNDNCLFYNQSKITFVSNRQIATDLRDISEYVLYYSDIVGSTEFRVYSLDFKTGVDSYSENKRFAEATTMRAELNVLEPSTHFFVCGTFNFYSTLEQGFEMLTGILSDNDGRSYDPINKVGQWYHNESFADIHTQSTRIAEFGGGSNNGLRKRPDMILISTAVADGIVYDYLETTYTTFGNDGLHYLLDVNDGINQSVADSVADALYYASDHLPLFLDFSVTGVPTPVELTNFQAITQSNNVNLSWSTASESNNYGFVIERKTNDTNWQEIGFESGNGTTSQEHHYSFFDNDVKPGDYFYHLKQVDFDGQFEFSNSIQVNIGSPQRFSLGQNYPNPFNASTIIKFDLSERAQVKLTLFDMLGKEITVILKKEYEAGNHEIFFNASQLNSGLYFYKLEAMDYIDMKKFIVIK
jgi:hypothetical protein